jgi:hypothetical protein
MKEFILARAKAFAAAAATAIAFGILTAAEQTFGFEIGESNKVSIVSAITGGAAYQVPNKAA